MDPRTIGKPQRFPDIRTEHLILRALELDDAARIYEYRSSPEVSRFQSWGVHDIEEIRSCIAGLSTAAPGTPGVWYQVGIVLVPNGNLIGDCAFRVLESEPRQAEFGITLDTAFQRRGYATQALGALLDYLLIALGKHRVFASVDPRNERSVQLMERVGLRKEAHFIKSLWFRGKWVDDLVFAILASEWSSKKKESKSPISR